MVFVADALAAHAGFCFCMDGSSAVKTKPARDAPPLTCTKTPAKNKCPKLYLHNASYTQPIFSGIYSCVRLPITGIMYFGLRQIAALPTRWTREPKP